MNNLYVSIGLVAGLIVIPLASNAQLAGRPVPNPIYGVTFDDVSNTNAEVTSLSHIVKMPTVRVVFDKGTGAGYYKTAITKLNPVAYTMGLLVDSSYMRSYTLDGVRTFTTNYVNTLGSLVDIWEIGNEVNGDWLSRQSNGADVFPKLQAMYDIVSAKGGRTAITFFYEGEPSDPNNCIYSAHGGGDMFTWINKQFVTNKTAASERMRLGLNYALVSWYPDQCQGASPDWPMVYTKLAQTFPNSKVGFGEIGTANQQNGSAYEKNLISTFYPMGKTTAGLPDSYIGGYFMWYWAEIGVPWPGDNSIGNSLNTAILAGP
jgi:hypothetical protein